MLSLLTLLITFLQRCRVQRLTVEASRSPSGPVLVDQLLVALGYQAYWFDLVVGLPAFVPRFCPQEGGPAHFAGSLRVRRPAEWRLHQQSSGTRTTWCECPLAHQSDEREVLDSRPAKS